MLDWAIKSQPKTRCTSLNAKLNDILSLPLDSVKNSAYLHAYLQFADMLNIL